MASSTLRFTDGPWMEGELWVTGDYKQTSNAKERFFGTSSRPPNWQATPLLLLPLRAVLCCAVLCGVVPAKCSEAPSSANRVQ